MATTLAIVGGVAAVGGTAAQFFGPGASSGNFDPADLFRIQSGRPLGNEAILSALSPQAMYELGVPIDTIEQEIQKRAIASNFTDARARGVMADVNRARALGEAGNYKGANKILQRQAVNLSKAGMSATYDPTAGLTFSYSDPGLQAQITQFRTNATQSDVIFQNRLKAMQNESAAVAGIEPITPEAIAAKEQQAKDYLNTFLDTAQSAEEAKANKLGYSPAGSIKTIQEERARVASGGALERALALIGGQTSAQSQVIASIKAGLEPALSGVTQNAAALSSQAGINSLQLALQLGIANAQAAQAANVSNLNKTAGAEKSTVGLGSDLLSAGLGYNKPKFDSQTGKPI